MNRRQLLRASAVISAAAILPRVDAADSASGTAFGPSSVRDLARALAAKSFEPPDEKLPDALKNLNYDQYRSIRFLPEHALWRGEKRPFEVQFFHRGFFYKNRVDIFEVADGRAVPIPYRRDDFSFGEGIGQWPDVDLGFAGFRMHAPINRPDYYDEVCVFLGASYFRAVAKGEIYGLSARGLVDRHRRDQGRRISRCSRHSGWRGRRRTPPRSSSTPCSTAKARPPAIASPSGPARPRSLTSRCRFIRASISSMAALRR